MDHPLEHRASTGNRIALRRIALRVLDACYRGMERSRQRRALALLSEARLRDIGLTRTDVADEIAKPFWRP